MRIGEIVRETGNYVSGVKTFTYMGNRYVQHGRTVYFAGAYYESDEPYAQRLNGENARAFYQATKIPLFGFSEPPTDSPVREYWESATGYRKKSFRDAGFLAYIFGGAKAFEIPPSTVVQGVRLVA